MRTLPSGIASHIQGGVTSLAVCWRIERRDGVLILGTEHEGNVDVPSGPYAGTYLARAAITGSSIRSNSDLAVDNMEVEGSVYANDLQVPDLSAADIEAGLFDDATVTLFLVNWDAPSDGQVVLRKGTLGAITRTSEGRYRTELRGLSQALSRPIVRTYGVACDADLFDARCGLSAAAWTYTATVVSVTSRREFSVSYDSPSPPAAGLLVGGKATFTSGENDDFSMEIRSVGNGSPDDTIVLFQPMPLDIQVGDTVSLTAGCDKRRDTCRDTFANLVNFRGHGIFTPGQTELLKVGKSGA